MHRKVMAELCPIYRPSCGCGDGGCREYLLLVRFLLGGGPRFGLRPCRDLGVKNVERPKINQKLENIQNPKSVFLLTLYSAFSFNF